MTRWNEQDIPDQTGRTALVTGANSGLGYRTALGLASHGARVLLGCRDTAKGDDAVRSIRAAAPDARVEVLPLDLADLASVRGGAAEAAARAERLDLLVNNAGVMALPRRTTADGFEMQLGTNHLGHFALTLLLLPRLLAAPRARVVTVSSGAHRMGRIRFDDLHGERGYNKWQAYGQSKLANLLFTLELQRRADAAGWPLVAASAHPGYASTNLQTAGPRMEGSGLGERLATLANSVVGQSEEKGALPILYAATMPDVLPADYWGPDGPLEARGHPRRVGRSKAALDGEVARRLWTESERLTGVSAPAA
jgi:NAD(P)-dependent dehydrogenase (short-subunit alcohol dehydrogenase family)